MNLIKSVVTYFSKEEENNSDVELVDDDFGNIASTLQKYNITLPERVDAFLSSGLVKKHDLKDALDGKFFESRIYAYNDRIKEHSLNLGEHNDHKSMLLSEKSRIISQLNKVKKHKVDPCEKNYQNSCIANLNDALENTVKSIEKTDSKILDEKNWLKVYDVAKTYPIIDLSFLGKITSEYALPGEFSFSKPVKVVLPRFATYNYFSSNSFVLSIRYAYGHRGHYIDDGFYKDIFTPEILKKAYMPNRQETPWCKDAATAIRSRADIGSSLDGFVPQHAKTAIESAKKIFNNDIYVIAEAKYSINYQVEKDPLVIGLTNKSAHFITAFDKTSLEEYVESNYVDGRGGKN